MKYSKYDHYWFQMAPLFKLLNILAKNYKVNLLNSQVINSLFSPLLSLESSNYFKIPIGEITMYLECLATLSTLLENNIFETKPNLFQSNQIQFLVAMSIKHGNTGMFQKMNLLEILSVKYIWCLMYLLFVIFKISVVWRYLWWNDFRNVKYQK